MLSSSPDAISSGHAQVVHGAGHSTQIGRLTHLPLCKRIDFETRDKGTVRGAGSYMLVKLDEVTASDDHRRGWVNT